MIKISETDLDGIISNIETQFADISKEEKKQYLERFCLYRNMFTKYIIEKINLKEYDEKIKNSNLNIKPNDLKDMDIYQYFSSELLEYFYIRNNIYLERLSLEETSFLDERIRNKNDKLDEEVINYIENTYKKVIVEVYDNQQEGIVCFYGPNTARFAAPSNALIIGMRYDEFVEDGLSDDEWIKQRDAQFLYINSLFDYMMVKLPEIVDMPVSIIKYNEYSVTKMNKEEQ